MTDLHTVDERLDAGDLYGAVRALRGLADGAPLVDLLAPLRRAAEAAGFDDLAGAATAVRERPQDPQALYDLGYACIERNIAPLAVAALTEADRRAPGQRTIIVELVAALERCDRYAEAVAVLVGNDGVLADWPDRYLVAVNAVQAGDLDTARRYASALSTPDGDWAHAARRVQGMLARAAALQGQPGRLDGRDLRGWHFVLNGAILATVSPYGFDEGMTGRYAFLQDSMGSCRRTLDRLTGALRAAGSTPSTVSPLPDRSSRILGIAAANVLGLPVVPFAAERTDTVIVAYDLNDSDEQTLRALWGERAPGAVLVEQASCWTDPPAVAADLTGLLHQVAHAPWGERLTVDGRTPPDDRPEEELAAELVAAAPGPDDDIAPGDSDADFAAFVRAVGADWPGTGARDRVFSPGPVRSSRFA
ncbi:hypothetical protein Val02_18070 [Virgisporangium aliadipatigenens]|uniref:Tetratricopeptide repeat protein n=1 Tax=Virgisporangium aliadipatigenens TaxID=741659 RepID=A0A8J4DPH0_9ACTN|nr:hypothetical protein [Virgisporangium aliadipatigenens]GIJ44921.1 hypothetical protein Val02_18070 [Virgisporangium aliadipatigenens]